MKKTIFITSLAALILEAVYQLLSLICGFSQLIRMKTETMLTAEIPASTVSLCALSTLVKAIPPLAVVILTFLLVSRFHIWNYIAEIVFICGVAVVLPITGSLINMAFTAMLSAIGSYSVAAYSYYTSGASLPSVLSSMAITLVTVACTISICDKITAKKAAKSN